MDPELKLMLAITRRLPAVKGAGRIANYLRLIYLRRHRSVVRASVRRFTMALDPHEFVDGWLLFGPQFYEDGELRFLERHLEPDDVFLDIGAHIGLYSLVASRAVGGGGLVLAVEADPQTYARLCSHLQWNEARNVRALNLGVSDRAERRRLVITSATNRAASSLLWEGDEGLEVDCRALLEILAESGIQTIGGAKFDIEGFEFRVLSRFFESASETLYPRFIITEFFEEWVPAAGGHTLELLSAFGYRVVATFRVAGKPVNYALVRG